MSRGTKQQLKDYFDTLPSWGGNCSVCNGGSDRIIRIARNLSTDLAVLCCKECFVKSDAFGIDSAYQAKCIDCNKIESIYDFRPFEGRVICHFCYRNNHWECNYCHNLFTLSTEAFTTVIDEEERRFCGQCHDLGSYLIHDYSYNPKFKFHKTDKDRRTLLYFGIELEVESMGCSKIEAVRSLPDFVYVKSDSSIKNGFEIVSHPMSYDWLRANEDKWNQVLELRKKGWRSYQTDTCGMHIHLSKLAFGNFHLYKFMKMFYNNPDFILRISQRSSDDLREWASVQDTEKNLIYKAQHKSYGQNGRHTAVALSRENSVEVRIFKGTLCPPSFWKNIEFVRALYDFTKDHNVTEINELNFRDYIKFKRKEYPNLYHFMWSEKYKERGRRKLNYCREE
jgi:hypothetical protein